MYVLCKIYESCKLYELCKLYENLMNHLKSLEIAPNHSQNCLNCFKYNIFVFKNFSKDFREYIKMENPNYKKTKILR